MSVNVGEAKGYLKLDISEFKSALQEAMAESQKGTQSIENSFANVGKNLESTGKKMTMYLTTPLVGAAGVAVKLASDFEKEMSKVQAISGATGEQLEILSEKAREMGSVTKYSASESAEAFQYMALAGWETEQMLNGIEPILKLAGAADMDLARASDIVTDALTAFKLEAKDAAHFTDVLATTMAKSNTDVDMLGEAFKYIGPLAGNLGYSVEDVALALGTMANSGIKASQAGTSLRRMLLNLTEPSDKTAAAMESLGISLFNLDGSAKPLKHVFDDLRNSLGAGQGDMQAFSEGIVSLNESFESGAISEELYSEKMANLIQSTGIVTDELKAQSLAAIAGATGMSGLAAIVGASAEEWDKLALSIDNCDGAASDMYDTMQDNLDGQITVLKSSLQELGIAFGNLLLPAIKDVIKFIQNLVNKMNGLSDNQKQMIIQVGKVAAIVGPLLLVVGKITTGIGGLVTALTAAKAATTALTTATTLLASPWLGIIAIIGTAVAGLAAWSIANYKANDPVQKLKTATEELTGRIKDNIQSYEEYKTSQADGVAKQLSVVNATQSYREELQQLYDRQETLTDKEKDRARFLAGELAKSIGVEIDLNEDLFGTISDLITEYDQLIEKKKADIMLGAMAEDYSKALNEQSQIARDGIEIFDKLQEAKQVLADSEAKYQEMLKSSPAAARIYKQTFDDLEQNVIDLGKALEENAALQAQYTDDIKAYEQAQTEAYKGNYEKVEEIFNKRNAQITKAVELQQKSAEEQVQILAQQVIDTQTKVDELIKARREGDKRITMEMIEEARVQAKAAADEFDSVGENIVNGVANGAGKESVLAKAIEAAKNIVRRMKQGAQEEAEIQSPSRLFAREVGAFIPGGVAKGVEENTYLAVDSTRQMMDDMAQASQENNIGQTIANDTTNGFISAWGKSIPLIRKEMNKDINEAIKGVDVEEIEANPGVTMSEDLTDYTDQIKPIYTSFAEWIMGVEDRMVTSINDVRAKLNELMVDLKSVSKESKDTLSSLTSVSKSGGGGGGGMMNMWSSGQTVVHHFEEDGKPVFMSDIYAQQGLTPQTINNTFNFTTDKPIDEIEAKRVLEKSYGDIAEGFVIA